MGFLTSSFMKSYAVRMHLQAQRKLMSITLRVGQVQRQQRNLQSQMKNQQRFGSMQAQRDYQIQYNQLMSGLDAPGMKDANGQLTDQGKQTYQNMQSSIFALQQNYQMNREMNSQMFDQYYEMQLEPLKDLEEDLQIEKQQAETDAQFWKGVQDSYTSAVKEDIKSVVPEAG